MALAPPFDQAVKPIISLFSQFSDKLTGLQDGLAERLTELQEQITDLPESIDCSDPRINDIKNLLNDINDSISNIQQLFDNIQSVINILIAIATIAAIAITIALIVPISNPGLERAINVSSFVVATILGILGLISAALIGAKSFISAISTQLQSAIETISSICPNETFNLNVVTIDDTATQFSGMTESEFYRMVNVSDSDLQDRERKIEQLLEQQRSLIDNLIEAPSNVFRNAGIPDSNIGKEGDYYIDSRNNNIFGPKISDTEWGSPLN